jgi:hypothetical protein
MRLTYSAPVAPPKEVPAYSILPKRGFLVDPEVAVLGCGEVFGYAFLAYKPK